MATEYRIDVVVDAGRSVQGSREFIRVMDDMGDTAATTSKKLDAAGRSQKKFSDLLMKSASSVFTYRDTILQLHESIRAGSTSLDRYARDIGGVAVAMRDAANAGSELVRVVSDLNSRGLKMGKLKEAAAGIATATIKATPSPAEEVKAAVKKDAPPPPPVSTYTPHLKPYTKPLTEDDKYDFSLEGVAERNFKNMRIAAETQQKTVDQYLKDTFGSGQAWVMKLNPELQVEKIKDSEFRAAIERYRDLPPVTTTQEVNVAVDASVTGTEQLQSAAQGLENPPPISATFDYLLTMDPQVVNMAALDGLTSALSNPLPIEAVLPYGLTVDAQISEAGDLTARLSNLAYPPPINATLQYELAIQLQDQGSSVLEATKKELESPAPISASLPYELGIDATLTGADALQVVAENLKTPEPISAIQQYDLSLNYELQHVDGVANLLEKLESPPPIDAVQAVNAEVHTTLTPDTAAEEQLRELAQPAPLDAVLSYTVTVEAEVAEAEALAALREALESPAPVSATLPYELNIDATVLNDEGIAAAVEGLKYPDLIAATQAYRITLDPELEGRYQLSSLLDPLMTPPVMNVVQPVQVSTEVVSADVSDIQQVVESVSSTEAVIMATVDTAEAEDRWASLKTQFDDATVNVQLLADTDDATSKLNEVEKALATLPDEAAPIKIEADTSATSDQFQKLLDDLDKLGAAGNEVAATFAGAARHLEDSLEGTREAINSTAGSAQQLLSNMGGDLFQRFVSELEEFERRGETTVAQADAMAAALDQLKLVGQSFGNDELIGWAAMARTALDELLPTIKVVDEQAEALKKQQEEAAKAAELEAEALLKLRRELDPIPVRLEELAQKEREWTEWMNAGRISAESYATGLKKLAEDRARLIDQAPPPTPPERGGGSALSTMASRLLQFAGVASVTSILREGMALSKQYEVSLVQLQNATSMTDEQLQGMAKTLEEVGEKFGATKLVEAAAALEIVQRGYRSAAEASVILVEANRIADATFGDVAVSARALSSAMAAFGLSADEAASAAETLTVASHGSATELALMTSMLTRLGTKIAQSGVSLEDYAAAVSTLKESGMESRRAMGALSGLIESLANVTPKAAVRFKELGIEVSTARIQHEGLAPVLQEIYEKTNGNKAAIERLMGSQQAATAVMSIMKNEGVNYAKVLEDIRNKTQLTDEMVQRTSDTFKKQADDLKSRLLNRLEELGHVIERALIPALRFMNENVNLVFGSLTALGTLVAGFSGAKLLSAAFTALGNQMRALTASTTTLAAAQTGQAVSTAAAGAASTATAAKLGILSTASTIATAAATKLTLAMRAAWTMMGGWVGLIVTAGSVLIGMAASAKTAKAAVMDLREETDNYIGSLSSMGKLSLSLEKVRQYDALIEAQKQLADAQEASRRAQINYDTALKRGDESMGRLHASLQNALTLEKERQLVVGETKARLIAVNDAMRAIGDTSREATRSASEDARTLNESYAQMAEQIRASDPALGISARRKELEELRTAVEDATGMDPTQRSETLSAISREMEELSVRATQLAMQKGPMAEFFKSIVTAVDPVAAATAAYDDKLLKLRMSVEAGAISQSRFNEQLALAENELLAATSGLDPAIAAAMRYKSALDALTAARQEGRISEAAFREQLALATVAYQAALTSGDQYATEVNRLTDSFNPAAAAQRAFNEEMAKAEVLLADQPELLAEYQAAATAAHETNLKLIALQNDSLVQLAAQYDPLIANEVARTKALIEMEGLLDRAKLSEQERAEWAEKAGQVINEQYDRQAREIQGNITLADAWKKAWESAIERIDGSFAELWKSAFDGMDAFKDQIKDTFKQLIAEIAHARITRPMIAKIGEIFSGQPKPGEVFGGGVTGDIMKRLMGIKENPAGVMATHQTAVSAIEEGTYKGYMRAMAGSAVAGTGELGGIMDGLEEISVWAEKIGSFGGDLGGKISEAMDSISLDGLTDGLQGAFGSALEKYFPVLSNAEQGATGVMGGAGGSGGVWQYLSSIPGISKFIQGMGTFGTTLSAFGTAFQGGMSTWLAGGGYSSMSQVALGAQSGVAGWGSMAGQAVGGAAVGYAGGWATDQLLGSRGNAGRNAGFSAVGGIIGSLWGPPGALIGGAIGSLVDNIIGGGKKVKDFGYEIAIEGGQVMGDFYTKIKKYGSWFSSKTVVKREELDWWNPVLRQMQAAFKETRNMLLGFAEELGGSIEAINDFNTDIKISTKGKKPEQVEAEVAQAQIDLAGRQIQAYLGAMPQAPVEPGDESSLFRRIAQIITQTMPATQIAENTDEILPAGFREILNTFMISGKDLIEMNPELKKAGDAFKNSMHYTQEFIEAFRQLATLTVALNLKPSVDGLEAYKKSTSTMTERYRELVTAAEKVYDQFDGTIESITAVTEAFVTQRTAAIELAAALYQVKEEISTMFKSTAESIRESLMNPEELYNYRRSRVDELTAQISTETDPGKIREMATEINSLVNTLYQGLDETQRAAMAPEFLSYLEGIDRVVGESVTAGLENLDQSATDANAAVMQAMVAGVQETAATQAATTQAFANSVGAFGQMVNRFGEVVAGFSAGGAQTSTPVTTTTQPRTQSVVGGFIGFSSSREVNT